MTDEELIAYVEAGTPPPEGFRHRDHVRAAWWYLRQGPLPDALGRFTTALRRFAEAQGKPERFHQTITTAYVLLIAERLDAMPDARWEDFAGAHPDLLAWPSPLLARYYREETLASERAKRVFVMPDGAFVRHL